MARSSRFTQIYQTVALPFIPELVILSCRAFLSCHPRTPASIHLRPTCRPSCPLPPVLSPSAAASSPASPTCHPAVSNVCLRPSCLACTRQPESRRGVNKVSAPQGQGREEHGSERTRGWLGNERTAASAGGKRARRERRWWWSASAQEWWEGGLPAAARGALGQASSARRAGKCSGEILGGTEGTDGDVACVHVVAGKSARHVSPPRNKKERFSGAGVATATASENVA